MQGEPLLARRGSPCTPSPRTPKRCGHRGTMVVSGRTREREGTTEPARTHTRCALGDACPPSILWWPCMVVRTLAAALAACRAGCCPSTLSRKYGRVFTAAVQAGWTPGRHCWLAQQCLLFCSEYGTESRKHSTKGRLARNGTFPGMGKHSLTGGTNTVVQGDPRRMR
jgi:hypothetical protein